MGIDVAKLRQMGAEIKKNAGGGGDKLFLYSNKLGEVEDIRILAPRKNLNGAYFVYQEGWWIDGAYYLTRASNGFADVVNAEIEAAKATKDKDLLALINKKKENGAPVLKREIRYLVPILHLDCKFDKDEQLIDTTVIDDAPKILVAKPTLLSAINDLVTSRNYLNGTDDGIADRVKGWHITIGKSGQKLDTTYTAIGWTQQIEMDEKYYGDKVPDILEISNKGIKSDEHVRSVIRNYLYGEAIIPEAEKEEKDKSDDSTEEVATEEAEEQPQTKAPARGVAKEETKAPARGVAKTEVKASPARGVAKTEEKASKEGRSLVDDVSANAFDNIS